MHFSLLSSGITKVHFIYFFSAVSTAVYNWYKVHISLGFFFFFLPLSVFIFMLLVFGSFKYATVYINIQISIEYDLRLFRIINFSARFM